MTLAFRPAAAPDLPFVIFSWLASFRDSHYAGLIAMEDWRDVMEPQILKALARPGVEVFVAYHPDEEDKTADLYGWLAVERGHERPFILYCYVKQNFRRMGIARRLFKAAGVDPTCDIAYACKTSVLSRLARVLPRARHTPHAARWPRERTPQGAR